MNKKFVVVMLALLLALVGAAVLMWRMTAPDSSWLAETKPEPKSTAEPMAESVTVTPARPPERERPAAPVRARRKKAVLAQVNGVMITEKDLVAGGSREPLEPEAAQELLEKAIDRELILEAAQAQGLTLRADQEESLDKYRNEMRNNEAYTASTDPETRARMEAELDFQLREVTAEFFLPELVGLPTETEAGAAEQARRRYLDGLRAGATIER